MFERRIGPDTGLSGAPGEGPVKLLSNDDIDSLLAMDECIGALEDAYRDFGNEDAVEIPRQDTIAPNAREGAVHVFKTMTGTWPRAGLTALRLNSDIVNWPEIGGLPRKVKLPVSSPGGRYNGTVLLFSTDTGQLLSMFPDGVVQKTRVGGTSGVAARHLARDDSRILGLLGTGWQAEAHLEAMCAVRRFEDIRVFSPNPDNRRRFAARFSDRLGVPVRAVDTADAAAADADVLVSATNSMTPTIRPEWIRPGMHITCVRGSELSIEVLRRADRIVLNSAEPVTAYPVRGWPSQVPDFTNGDYSRPDIGVFDMSAAPELKDVLAGKAPGRTRPEEVTCFHNFKGVGIQFVALASLVYRHALERGIGVDVDDAYFTQTVHP